MSDDQGDPVHFAPRSDFIDTQYINRVMSKNNGGSTFQL